MLQIRRAPPVVTRRPRRRSRVAAGFRRGPLNGRAASRSYVSDVACCRRRGRSSPFQAEGGWRRVVSSRQAGAAAASACWRALLCGGIRILAVVLSRLGKAIAVGAIVGGFAAGRVRAGRRARPSSRGGILRGEGGPQTPGRVSARRGCRGQPRGGGGRGLNVSPRARPRPRTGRVAGWGARDQRGALVIVARRRFRYLPARAFGSMALPSVVLAGGGSLNCRPVAALGATPGRSSTLGRGGRVLEGRDRSAWGRWVFQQRGDTPGTDSSACRGFAGRPGPAGAGGHAGRDGRAGPAGRDGFARPALRRGWR